MKHESGAERKQIAAWHGARLSQAQHTRNERYGEMRMNLPRSLTCCGWDSRGPDRPSRRREGRLMGWIGFVQGFAGHGHEPDGQHSCFLQVSALLAEQHQFLVSQWPDRNDHPPAVPE